MRKQIIKSIISVMLCLSVISVCGISKEANNRGLNIDKNSKVIEIVEEIGQENENYLCSVAARSVGGEDRDIRIIVVTKKIISA